MKNTSYELMSKFFVDYGKITFALLAIGAAVKRPFSGSDFLLGLGFTLILAAFGFIISELEARKL